MLSLRNVHPTDLPIFYSYHLDADAVYQVAFLPKEREQREIFDAHWERILHADGIVIRTIEVDERVAGHLLRFMMDAQPQIGYWIGREFWGQGIATQALRKFITEEETQRPLHAAVVADNIGSLRVLEKCGFEKVETVRSYAQGRGEEVDEIILILRD